MDEQKHDMIPVRFRFTQLGLKIWGTCSPGIQPKGHYPMKVVGQAETGREAMSQQSDSHQKKKNCLTERQEFVSFHASS